LEEYIKKLLEQVRFEKAHKAIGDEVRSHIEDQIETNICEGMDKETAEKKAVEDMGDPIEAGISLDKVHRPQIAWGVIISAILVGVIGTLIQFYIHNDALLNKHLNYDTGVGNNGFIASTVLGIALMLLLYLVDYTTVARYSRVAAVFVTAFYLFTIYGGKLYWNVWSKKYVAEHAGDVYSVEEMNSVLDSLLKLNNISFTFMFLLIPLYAGILYKYRGQSYVGLIKALLWIVIPRTIPIMSMQFYGMRSFIVVGSMLVQLTIAISVGWIKVRKVPVITSLWSVYALYLGYAIHTGYRFEYWLSNEGKAFRSVIDSMKLYGKALMFDNNEGMKVPSGNSIPSPDKSYVLTYISATWGVAVGVAVITIVAALIALGFFSVFKTKNQLGRVMGCGCMMWIAVNSVANIIVGFGLVPEFYESFFPFISSDNTIVSYVFLGILISVYKYKDAYSRHVDIGADNEIKGVES